MLDERKRMTADISGRIDTAPGSILLEEVLVPQFSYDLRHLFSHYILIELALVLEYERMALVDHGSARRLADILTNMTPACLDARAESNMSDIAFAIERHVESLLESPIPAWHLDRSRNDYQACAQVMFARGCLCGLAEELLDLVRTILDAAAQTISLPMPGYTHYQSAQVITPAFHMAALSDRVLASARRMLRIYDEVNSCPLGSGPLAGQQLAWDRSRLAGLLGFSQPVSHALVGVASRDWALLSGAELSNLGITLSRFVTDLLIWGSSEYRFFDLPDELSGISSAMPQKKNFPVLERIRGRTAHLSAHYLDFALGQRNTPYTNLVEVSKEANVHALSMFETAGSAVRLLRTVIRELRFDPVRMREAAGRDYLGGFTLANQLTLQFAVPYRLAQVIAGRYIMAALARGLGPSAPSPELLHTIAAEHDQDVQMDETALGQALDVDSNLLAGQSAGSANPWHVSELLGSQAVSLDHLTEAWEHRRHRIATAAHALVLAAVGEQAATAETAPLPRIGSVPERAAGMGTACGTFGELLQGGLPGGLDFLVTLPITTGSRAVFISTGPSGTVTVQPASKVKSLRLATAILDRLDLPRAGLLVLDSDLPEGKGLASSSADLVATARAIEAAFSLDLGLGVLQSLMSDIEPSDGVMYDGIVAFYHRRVRLAAYLGPLPPLAIVAVDEGGEVDTISFNAIPKPFSGKDLDEYRGLLADITEAVRVGDVQTIGRVATRSAIMNQRLRPKTCLDTLIDIAGRIDALGVNVAHSGTYAGVLLSPSDPRFGSQLEAVLAQTRDLPGSVSMFYTRPFREGLNGALR